MKTVFESLPEKAVILAVMILSFKDSKTSQSLTIVPVLLLHVKLTTTVLSPMYVTLSCTQQIHISATKRNKRSLRSITAIKKIK